MFTLTMLSLAQTCTTKCLVLFCVQMDWFWRNPVGRILNRFTRDIDAIDRMMIKSAQDWMNFMTIAIGAVITMCVVVSYLLALVFTLLDRGLVCLPAFLWPSRQLKRLAGVTRSPIFRRLDEYMRRLIVVRSLGMEDSLAVPFQNAIDLNVNSEILFEATATMARYPLRL